MEDEIYLVLPSNVAPKIYPRNVPNHFYTPLSEPLYLDKPGWRVALKEITFENNIQTIVNEAIEVWRDEFDGYELADKLWYDSKNNVKPQNEKHIGIDGTNFIVINKSVFLHKYNPDDVVFSIEVEGEPKTEHKFGNFHIATIPIKVTDKRVTISLWARPVPEKITTIIPKPGHYPNKKKLVEELNRYAGYGGMKFGAIAFSVVTEGEERRIKLVALPTGWRLVLINGMHITLGYSEVQLRGPQTAEMKADLTRSGTAMFVYCDLVEPVIVGDSLVPLLRTTYNSGDHGTIINRVFNPPIYLKTGKTYVNAIEIELRTDTGDPFPLMKDAKVILTLHLIRQ